MSGNLTKGLVAAAIGTTTIIALAGVASAHDFKPTAPPAQCVEENGIIDKVITVTVTNQFDMAATFTSSYLSGTTFSLTPLGSNHYIVRFGGSHTGTSTDTVGVTWTDKTFVSHKVDLVWGSSPCELPPMTEPPTTAPPVIETVPTVPPTTAPPVPTTVRVCADGNAPSIPVEDGSLVCPEFFPPTTQAPVVHQEVATTVQRAIVLPTTGASSIQLAGIAFLIGLAGLGAVVLTRKRAEAE